jgi:tryptophan-rich sensory protein
MSAWKSLRSRRGLRNLALTGAAAATSSALGAVATSPQSDWYESLDKPAWQPPPVAFPLVWTPLYADIAATTAAALTALEEQGRSAEAAALRRALGLNLALNTGWSLLFFRAHRTRLSALWSGILAAQSADLARRCGRADRSLAATLAPYPAWCTFATALNAAVARRNA